MVAGTTMKNVGAVISINHRVGRVTKLIDNILRGPFGAIRKTDMFNPALSPGILDGDAVAGTFDRKYQICAVATL